MVLPTPSPPLPLVLSPPLLPLPPPPLVLSPPSLPPPPPLVLSPPSLPPPLPLLPYSALAPSRMLFCTDVCADPEPAGLTTTPWMRTSIAGHTRPTAYRLLTTLYFILTTFNSSPSSTCCSLYFLPLNSPDSYFSCAHSPTLW